MKTKVVEISLTLLKFLWEEGEFYPTAAVDISFYQWDFVANLFCMFAVSKPVWWMQNVSLFVFSFIVGTVDQDWTSTLHIAIKMSSRQSSIHVSHANQGIQHYSLPTSSVSNIQIHETVEVREIVVLEQLMPLIDYSIIGIGMKIKENLVFVILAYVSLQVTDCHLQQH